MGLVRSHSTGLGGVTAWSLMISDLQEYTADGGWGVKALFKCMVLVSLWEYWHERFLHNLLWIYLSAAHYDWFMTPRRAWVIQSREQESMGGWKCGCRAGSPAEGNSTLRTDGWLMCCWSWFCNQMTRKYNLHLFPFFYQMIITQGSHQRSCKQLPIVPFHTWGAVSFLTAGVVYSFKLNLISAGPFLWRGGKEFPSCAYFF